MLNFCITMHETPDQLHKTPNLAEFVPLLHHIGTYSAKRGRDFPPHQHLHWELVFYRRGYVEAPVGTEVHRARPGVLLLTPPQTMHSESALTDYANFHAIVEAPPTHPWPLRVHDDAHGTFYHLFSTLHREYQAERDDSPAFRALLMQQLDFLLQRALRDQPPTEAELRVREAEILWEEAPERDWSIESTARYLGMAASQLRTHFAGVRQQAPSEVLREIRLRRALALLGSSNTPLETIARHCGFYSASHLSRHIKASTGQSPGAWRQYHTQQTEVEAP